MNQILDSLEYDPERGSLSLQSARYVLFVFFVIAIVAAAAGMAFQNRKTERIVRERLHLQAWQLRQLVS